MEPLMWGSEADGMVVRLDGDADPVQLHVEGELDTHGATFLAQAVEAALASGAKAIQLELGAVSFLDSAGLGEVLRARRACAEAGVALNVGSTSAAAARLIELAGVGELLADGPGDA